MADHIEWVSGAAVAHVLVEGGEFVFRLSEPAGNRFVKFRMSISEAERFRDELSRGLERVRANDSV